MAQRLGDLALPAPARSFRINCSCVACRLHLWFNAGGKKVKLKWILSLGAAAAAWLIAAQTAPAPGDGEERRLISSLEGQALYREYCAVCHGEMGKGDGPMAKALKTPPADLTRIAMHNGGTFPLKKVERIISGDSPVEPGHGTREMPLWGPIFSQITWDVDLGNIRVANLAKYIESLQK